MSVSTEEESVSSEEEYVTAMELAGVLRVSVWTVYRLKKKHGWPHSGVGRGIRFSRDDVAAIKIQIQIHKAGDQSTEPDPGYTPAQLARARERLGLPGPRQSS